jgi:hypothetical protein
VEGKEALLALLRDLTLGGGPSVLDSIVLVAVPIYNADGNEKLAPQATNRSEQNGPEMVGERANAQGLDLNRDYVKAEAPETRASLSMFARWDPDVFVDLHTTNGSYHGYALTYAPSLHPSAPLGAYTHDVLLPELRRRVQERHGVATFPYGNFSQEYGADVSPDTVKQGWFTYDHRPRFGTNYYGLRGGVAILSEAYSHDPFERRVRATSAFVREILTLAAERGAEIRRMRAESRAAAGVVAGDVRPSDASRGGPPTGNVGAGARPGGTESSPAGAAGGPGRGSVALRSEITRTPRLAEVIAEDLAAQPDSAPTEPGVPRGLRRTGHFRTLRIPVHDRFDATLVRALPSGQGAPGGYVVDAGQAEVARLLRRHGLLVRRLLEPAQIDAQVFRVDSVIVAPRPFQGHHETRLEGRWVTERRRVPAGSYVVPAATPLDLLAAVLLEPESDDGLAAWNLFDGSLRAGGEYPVVRATVPVSGRQEELELP